MRTALYSGSLDEVKDVLGKMLVPHQEKLAVLLGTYVLNTYV